MSHLLPFARSTACVACFVVLALFANNTFAQTTGLPAVYATAVTENTVSGNDAPFIGPPDDKRGSLERDLLVTVDFGDLIVLDRAGADFNVYEGDVGAGEVEKMTVSVSANGIDFYNVDAARGTGLDLQGDEEHGQPDWVYSYDISGTGLTAVRYIRVQGNDPDGGTSNGFELDAIGAVANVPEPASITLVGMAFGSFLLTGRRRNRR